MAGQTIAGNAGKEIISIPMAQETSELVFVTLILQSWKEEKEKEIALGESNVTR